jgi:hypothetical protein
VTVVGDRFSTWDAAYVLGALSPEDRREFEEHLAICPSCQLAIAEIAGMPGLLAAVAPEDAAMWSEAPVPGVDYAPPDTLLPKMITQIRSRRRRTLTALVGVAAALLLLLGGIGIGRALPTNEPARVAFTSVTASSMTAVADLVPVPGGTDIRLECQYGETSDPMGHEAAYADYSIYVVDRNDQAQDVKNWTAKPNKVMRPAGTTPLSVAKIKRIEVRRTDTGETVLQALLR